MKKEYQIVVRDASRGLAKSFVKSAKGIKKGLLFYGVGQRSLVARKNYEKSHPEFDAKTAEAYSLYGNIVTYAGIGGLVFSTIPAITEYWLAGAASGFVASVVEGTIRVLAGDDDHITGSLFGNVVYGSGRFVKKSFNVLSEYRSSVRVRADKLREENKKLYLSNNTEEHFDSIDDKI